MRLVAFAAVVGAAFAFCLAIIFISPFFILNCLLNKKNQPIDALKTLEASPADAFELAELQRIKAYLTQKDGEQALTHLEFLNGHQLSPWLIDLKHSYEQKLIQLWGVFAVQFPWIYLKSTQHGHLEAVG